MLFYFCVRSIELYSWIHNRLVKNDIDEFIHYQLIWSLDAVTLDAKNNLASKLLYVP